ncbi:hypothetical protein QE393_003859 [Pseudomonas sp. SORGH_AS 211]|nr:hypothetical protein [Pseudomonas sp. SORGH_AS_0211]
MLGPGLRRVEQLVGKLAAQLGLARLDGGIALLLGRRQVDAGQAEITQGVFQGGLLAGVEALGFFALGQAAVGLEEVLVLADLGGIGRQLGQAGLVGGAQLGAVAHGVEVADGAPGLAQPIVQLVHRQHQAGPGGVFLLRLQQLGQGGTVLGQDGVDGRLDVLGLDGGKGRQVVGLKQRIAGAHGVPLGAMALTVIYGAHPNRSQDPSDEKRYLS